MRREVYFASDKRRWVSATPPPTYARSEDPQKGWLRLPAFPLMATNLGELKKREHKPINYSKAGGDDDNDADFKAKKRKKKKTSSDGPKKKPGGQHQGNSAIASAKVQVCDYTTLRAIEGMEHFNTVSLVFENSYSNRKLADVFNFGDKSGWKAACGEGEKAGWFKMIPVGLLPKGFKVGGKAPRGLTAKVFIEYLGQRAGGGA